MSRLVKNLLIILTLAISASALPSLGYAAAQTDKKPDSTISFLGTLEIPSQLEIIDMKDVFIEIIKMGEKLQEEKEAKEGSSSTGEIPKKISEENLRTALNQYDIGAYQFALKQNGSYNQAFVLAAKLPPNMKEAAGRFLGEMKTYDKKKQSELKALTEKAIQDAIASTPELKTSFSFELLEFYPFEYTKKGKLQMISAGGSMAVRTYKLIQPFAVKTYLLEKNSDYYVFAIINSGSDRKLWDNLTKEMLLKLN